MEAARRLDEWRVLSKKIPSVDMVPEFVVQDNREGQINLNTSEWLILSKIDGHAQHQDRSPPPAGLSVFDVAKILYGLIATGLIRLRERAPRRPRCPLRARPPPPAQHRAARPRAAAAAAPAHAPRARPPSRASPELLGRLNRVRDVCNSLLGTVGESVVNKHYQKARSEIERGAGVEAVEEAISQIARAASILKGPVDDRSPPRAAQGRSARPAAPDADPRAGGRGGGSRRPHGHHVVRRHAAARAAGGRARRSRPGDRRAGLGRRPGVAAGGWRSPRLGDARLPRVRRRSTACRRSCTPGAGSTGTAPTARS